MTRVAALILALTSLTASADERSAELLARASVDGKYQELVTTLLVPEDQGQYGAFHDYGRWKGGAYRGFRDTPAGYWVYVAPYWYVWASSTTAATPPPRIPDDDPHRPKPEEPPRISDDDPFAPALRWAREHGFPLPSPGARQGELAQLIAPSSGGFLFMTVRDDRTEAEKAAKDRDGYAAYVAGKKVPLLVRLDGAGATLWQRSYAKKGFLDYGAGALAETKDGNFIALLPSYPHPSGWPVARVLKVRRDGGELLWERRLRGDGGAKTPVVQAARLTERGTVRLTGIVYLQHGEEQLRLWRGELAADGKLLVDRNGPLQPYTALRPAQPDERFIRDKAAAGTPQETAMYRHALSQHLAMAGPSWHLAPDRGVMVPVAALKRGGFVLAGVRPDGQPVVAKLDASGRAEWERPAAAPGFEAYGGGLCLEAPDGTLVAMIPSFRDDGWGFVPRFVGFSAGGEKLWESAPRVIAASGRAPEFETARFTERGTVEVRGFAYLDEGFEKLHVWDGELDLNGRWLKDQVAGPRQPPGTMQVIVPPPAK